MKTPITYYGGKQMLLKYILPLIPSHKLYCEPFFGGGAVLFAKPPSETEVVNDINGELVNFFQVVKKQFPELQKEIQATPHSRELYKQAMIVYSNPQLFNLVKRAWAVWVTTNQGFASMIGSWGFGKDDSKEASLKVKRENFVKAYADRLAKVQLEHNDALKVLARCDDKEAFAYCDPPYIGSDMGHYKGYTETEYKNLLDALSKFKGKFLLSSYPSSILNSYIKKYKWRVKKIVKSIAVTKHTDKQKTEMLVFNYEPSNKPMQGIHNDELNGHYLTPKDVATEFIKPYIMDGDTFSFRPSGKLSVTHEDYSAHIENEDVVVTMLYGTEIRELFAVNDLMHEITDAYFKQKYQDNDDATPSKPRKLRTTFNHKQPEFKVLKAILNWHNASVSKRQVGCFIDELQGYIKSKKITKKSIVAKEINLVQEKLISVFNTMEDRITITLSPEVKKVFQLALKKVTDVNKTTPPKKGNSLNGIAEQTPIEPPPLMLTEQPKINIMKSTDFINMQFNTLGFKDKWLTFIGDPSAGFTAMVFGMPKMGKSYLCVDFAGYLARNHGRVLYVAKEEKLDKTLQDKLKDKNVAHENLTVADAIPSDLSAFNFVFLDSVNKMRLSSKDLEQLKLNNKGVSFVYIFQATKGGQFKGNNEFQHDVDVVIEVPELGKATQYGRFNQGGKINIFD